MKLARQQAGLGGRLVRGPSRRVSQRAAGRKAVSVLVKWKVGVDTHPSGAY